MALVCGDEKVQREKDGGCAAELPVKTARHGIDPDAPCNRTGEQE
jgi:hypothetical protein